MMITRWVLCVASASWRVEAFAWSNASQQERFMRDCIILAKEAEALGGSPYGALIADPKRGLTLATGMNNAALNPTLHGEIAAINNLTAKMDGASVYSVASELELYTTAEPCPMCMGAIAWSGFGRVIYGTSIPYIEAQGANQIDIRAIEVSAAAPWANVEVVAGVLSNETDLLYEMCRSKCNHAHSHAHQDGTHEHEHPGPSHDKSAKIEKG
jgi:tRNA(adenine34) deaminase